MPVVRAPSEPTHDLGDTRFTSLATPTTGATDTAVRMICCMPVGGGARTVDGALFTPPWAT